MSPPHNNALLNQRDSMLITQPSSIPSSPLASPSGQSSTSFCLQSPSALSVTNINSNHEADDPTTDPNWQATKPTVRERNAAMFNNELMADIKFLVGCDGERLTHQKVSVLTSVLFLQSTSKRFQPTNTFWRRVRRCFTRCSSAASPRTNQKFLYLMWNRRRF